jgi:hypothetical protein
MASPEIIVPTGNFQTDPITVGSAIDKFGTHFDYLGIGGWRAHDTVGERDAIPVTDQLESSNSSGRRRRWMVVYCGDVKKSYQLQVPDADWDAAASDADRIALLANNAYWEQLPDYVTVDYLATRLSQITDDVAELQDDVNATEQDILNLQTEQDGYVHKAGDEMTGPLTLPAEGVYIHCPAVDLRFRWWGDDALIGSFFNPAGDEVSQVLGIDTGGNVSLNTPGAGVTLISPNGAATGTLTYSNGTKLLLNGAEIGNGPATTNQLPEGTSNKYFTDARAVAAVLVGYVKAGAARAIAATDSIRTALGLLEKKADDNATALNTKADLVGGKVPQYELPLATVQQVKDGNDGTVLVTPATLRQSGATIGGDVLMGSWNPNTNTPFLYEAGSAGAVNNVKGQYYEISAGSTKVTNVTINSTNNDSYLSINGTVGIGYGMLVTGTGLPAGTRVYQAYGNTLVLDRNVTIATGVTLTFVTYFGGYSAFTVGDKIGWTGTAWKIRRDTLGDVVGTGNAVTFDQARRWPVITTGTYTVTAIGAQVDVCFQLILGVGATEIQVPATGFVKLGGAWTPARTNIYWFVVGVDGLIEYYVVPGL